MKKTKITDYKLPKKFKAKWLKALRSGEYKQGRSSLVNNSNEYCCIGVAGHICGVKNTDMLNKGTFNNYNINAKNEAIKCKVPEQLIGSDGTSSDANLLVRKLVKMNDNGKSFKFIAAYVERYL